MLGEGINFRRNGLLSGRLSYACMFAQSLNDLGLTYVTDWIRPVALPRGTFYSMRDRR